MKRILGLGMVLGLAPMTGEALAQVTFDVNTLVDGHDAAVGDGQCTTDAGDCSLRAAVEETNALPGADTIYVPFAAGVYELELETSTRNAGLEIFDYLEIRGDGPWQSIITTGGRTGVVSVMTVETLVLDNAGGRISPVTWGGVGQGAGFAGIPANSIRLVGESSNALDNDYLLTTLNDGVLRYSDVDGTLVGTLIPPVVNGTTIAGADVLVAPSTVANVPEHIFVANLLPGGGVYHFDATGTFLGILDTGGTGAGALEWNYSDDTLLVTLPAISRIARFDTFGNRLADFASAVPDRPRDLTRYGEYFYIASDDNDGIYRLRADGTGVLEVFVFPGTGGLDEPQFLEFAPDGELFVYSHGTEQILRYDGRTGAFAGVYAEAGMFGLSDAGSFVFKRNRANGPFVRMTDLTIAEGGRVIGSDSCVAIHKGAAAEIRNAIVRNCYSSVLGGGIHNAGLLWLNEVAIYENRLPEPGPGGQTSQGGGVYNQGQLFIADSLISDNFAGRGSAVSADFDADRTDIVNTTISGNYSAGEGAVRIHAGTANIVNTTITQNETPRTPIGPGGGIDGYNASGLHVANGATAYLANSVVADNSNLIPSDPEYAPDCFNVSASDPSFVPGYVVSINDNVIGTLNAGCNILDQNGFFPSDLMYGSNSAPFDPELAALADNGGPTMTHYPLPGSPLIDGDLTDAALPLYNCQGWDQRLQPRPIDGDQDGLARCDIGAAESLPSTANDVDADGIDDAIDLDPTGFSLIFSDVGSSGNTTGFVLDLGNQLLTVSDAPGASGITVSADPIGGAAPAVLVLCEDQVMVEVAPGQTETFTCVVADAGPDQTVECTGQGQGQTTLVGFGESLSGAAVDFEWSAFGATLQNPTASTTTGTFPLGSTLATLFVSLGGEVAVDTALIEVVDTVKPVVTAPPDVVTASCTGVSIGQATALDACGGVLPVTSDAPATFKSGVWTITWTAVDAKGNVGTATQRVTVGLGDSSSCCPTGSNIINGTANNDVLTGTSARDCILGKGGQDTLRGMGGDDLMSGGEGDDTLEGGNGNDLLSGGNGQDVLRGQANDDSIVGDGGDDQCYGFDGNDTIYGGGGQDKLYGEVGADKLFGDSGFDRLEGGPGDDNLNGGSENDTCLPGSGSNTLLSCEVTQ